MGTTDALLPENADISSFCCENRHANCPTIILLEIHHSLLFDVMIIFEKLYSQKNCPKNHF